MDEIAVTVKYEFYEWAVSMRFCTIIPHTTHYDTKKNLKFLPIHVWRVDILPFELIIFLIGF